MPENRLTTILRLCCAALVLSFLTGLIVALFLATLDWATQCYWRDTWLIVLLPLAGLFSGWIYHHWGQDCEAGNHVIYQAIQTSLPDPSPPVPAQMAPLVFIGTILTHLAGGSAGREGTAIQIGGSLGATIARWFRLPGADTRSILCVGIATGFGAVFGTPLAATIFAVEVIGRGATMRVMPLCLVCAILADMVTSSCGIEHTQYLVAGEAIETIRASWLVKITAAAFVFGLAALFFVELVVGLKQNFQRLVPVSMYRAVVGGVLLMVLVGLLGTSAYQGLGVTPNPYNSDATSIVNSFAAGGASLLAWWWKMLVTAITLASGFKGGEATPLFFIGANLGSALSPYLALPADLLAALGFVSLFAAATRTPVACTMMAIELFAWQANLHQACCLALYACLTCWIASSLQHLRSRPK